MARPPQPKYQPQPPLDSELTINLLFLLSSLHGYGMQITDMRTLQQRIQQFEPYPDLRALFGQGMIVLHHVRITNRRDNGGEQVLFSGSQEACMDYARHNVADLLDRFGQHFLPVNASYPTWQSQSYILYVVPASFTLQG